MDRTKLLRDLERNTAALEGVFAATPAELERRYGPGKWKAREVLAHVSDCELVNLWRFFRAVAEPGSVVEPFDQDPWAAALAYPSRPVEVSRDLFLGARRALTHHVRTLDGALLARTCRHAEKGELTGWQWARLAQGHAAHHLDQIEAPLAGKPWVKKPEPEGWMYGAGAREA